MSLLKKINNKGLSEAKTIGLVATVVVANAVWGIVTICNAYYQKKVNDNLAPNAVFSKNLKLYNEDTDKDGKYETIVRYKGDVSLPVLKIERDKDFNWIATPIQFDYKKELYKN